MMEIFAIALLAFVLAMFGMAVGMLAGRHGLESGCAAYRTTTDGASECESCGKVAGTDGCNDATPLNKSRMTEA